MPEQIDYKQIDGMIAGLRKDPRYSDDKNFKASVDMGAKKLRQFVRDGALESEAGMREIMAILENIHLLITNTMTEKPETELVHIDVILGLLFVPDPEVKVAHKKFSELVDSLILTGKDRKKLKESLSVVRIHEACKTALEFDPTLKFPYPTTIYKEIINLGVKKLRSIGEFGKPTLLVVPKTNLEDKISAMNRNQHLMLANVVCLIAEPNSPYRNMPKATHNYISIVEGVQEPTWCTAVPNDPLKIRKETFEAHLAQHDLEMINIHEYAVLMQQSLRECRESSGKTEIVDDYLKGQGTITILSNVDLSKSDMIAAACHNRISGNVEFGVEDPDSENDCYRVRPTVGVMGF